MSALAPILPLVTQPAVVLDDACDQLMESSLMVAAVTAAAATPADIDSEVVDEFHAAKAMPRQLDDDEKEEAGNAMEEVNNPLANTSNCHQPDAGTGPRLGDSLTSTQRNGSKEGTLERKRFVSPKDFELLKVIGMGAFGKVLQVRNRHNQQVLAMKVISKRLLNRKSGYVENIRAERDILTQVRHPFVVQMHCSFQTSEKLFIIMDFLAGGELFLRLGREGIFLEKTAAFYLAEIILALNHLHSRNILHRDLVSYSGKQIGEKIDFSNARRSELQSDWKET